MAVGLRQQRWRPRFLLSHANPQIRYAVSVMPAFSDGALVGLLPSERCAIVRRALARRLAEEPHVASDALKHALRFGTPEAVYIYEGVLVRARMRTGSVPRELRDALGETNDVSATSLPPQFERLAAITADGARAPGVRALMLDWSLDCDESQQLDAAFRAGMQFGDRPALRRPPLDVVRSTVRSLSPFDEGGLGTYSELRQIEAVDRAYLELSQVLFLAELGLLVDA